MHNKGKHNKSRSWPFARQKWQGEMQSASPTSPTNRYSKVSKVKKSEFKKSRKYKKHETGKSSFWQTNRGNFRKRKDKLTCKDKILRCEGCNSKMLCNGQLRRKLSRLNKSKYKMNFSRNSKKDSFYSNKRLPTAVWHFSNKKTKGKQKCKSKLRQTKINTGSKCK